MSGDYYDNKRKNAVGKRFTHAEAVRFEREMLNAPTGTNTKYKWVDSKTGREVNFNY